jgi:uncharacterized membrane protein (UPF0127 family)
MAATAGGFAARNVTREADLATSLEVAGSLWAKFMGLMGRRSLAPGEGLWLPESNGIHMMFMRFPIDAIFVGRAEPAGSGGSDGSPGAAEGAGAATADPGAGVGGGAGVGEVRRVLSIHRTLPAWTGLVPLVRGAHGVLELPTGTIDASGTQVGDLIRLS